MIAKKNDKNSCEKRYSFHAAIDETLIEKISKPHFPHRKRIVTVAFVVVFIINLFYAARNMAFFKSDKSQSSAPEFLKEKARQDAENQAVLFYNMDSGTQAKKWVNITCLDNKTMMP